MEILRLKPAFSRLFKFTKRVSILHELQLSRHWTTHLPLSNITQGRKSVPQVPHLALDVNKEKVLIDWILRLHRLGVPARPSGFRAMTDHVWQARSARKLPLLGPESNWAARYTAGHP